MEKFMEKVELGDRVQDKVSGLKGIVQCLSHWLYGCTRITIQPEVAKDGKPAEMFTIDEPQCKILKKGALSNQVAEVSDEGVKRTYGPRPDAPRQSGPKRSGI